MLAVAQPVEDPSPGRRRLAKGWKVAEAVVMAVAELVEHPSHLDLVAKGQTDATEIRTLEWKVIEVMCLKAAHRGRI